MKRSLIASAILLACSSAPVFAQEAAADAGPLAAANFSSTLAFTTNYMFRGISNADGPAVQGSMDYTYNGFFAGAWGSNTEFSDANFEIDFYGGYRFSYTGLDFTLQGLYYMYPGEDESGSEGFDPIGVEADYGELNLGVSHTFAGQLTPTVGFNYFYSPEAFGEDGSAHTFQFNGGVTLPMGVGLYGVFGYSTTEGDKSSGALGGVSYQYFQAGGNYVVKGFKLDVSYVGTDLSESLKEFYLNTSPDNFRKLVEGEVVFTISRTF